MVDYPDAKTRWTQRVKRLGGRFAQGGALAGDGLLILNYHSLAPNEVYATPPSDFARQMEYVAEHFQPTSLDEWLSDAALVSAKPRVLVTFDDGFADVHTHGLPVLQRYGLQALIFVTTGFVLGETQVAARLSMYRHLPALNWTQLRELAAAGVAIGSHTHQHLHLGEATKEQVWSELTHSKALLEDHLQQAVRHFAYPWGQRAHIGSAAPALLPKLGYASACTTLWGRNAASDDAYWLRRVRIDAWDRWDDFTAKLHGAWDFIGWLQARA